MKCILTTIIRTSSNKRKQRIIYSPTTLQFNITIVKMNTYPTDPMTICNLNTAEFNEIANVLFPKNISQKRLKTFRKMTSPKKFIYTQSLFYNPTLKQYNTYADPNAIYKLHSQMVFGKILRLVYVPDIYYYPVVY
ncbi:MAG: hypothetical protein EBS86_13900 [Crocinitomicaceae bacterium]|nr:hypothetical protein [Crocinitomicaceae bacterium]